MCQKIERKPKINLIFISRNFKIYDLRPENADVWNIMNECESNIF
jgi:hypothetical protein